MTEPTACDSQNPHSLTSPGQLIANLPAILGFFPRESIVLATFQSVEGSTYALGPTLRLDIGAVGATTGLRELWRTGGALSGFDLVFCVVISERVLARGVRCPELAASVRDVEEAVAEAGGRLAGIWGCQEIITGTRFVSLCREVDDYANPGWAEGTVSSVVGSAAMEQWVSAGKLPEVSREEVFGRFESGNPFYSADELQWIQEGGSVGPGGGIVLVEELGDLILEAEGRSEDDLLADAELLRLCADVLGTVQLRDAAVGDILGTPSAAAPVMLAAAKSLRGFARANALCLYALAVIAQGFPMDANPALITALDEDPRHSLSRLILNLLHTGDLDALLHSVYQGSEVARRGAQWRESQP